MKPKCCSDLALSGLPAACPSCPRILPILALVLVPLIASAAQAPPALSFESRADFENFVLSDDDGQILKALVAVLEANGADRLIQAAVSVGPAQASQIAAILPDEGFRQGYRDVAKYLDLYAPCHKQIAPAATGWWSNYPDPPTSHYCGEAVKLLYSALIWNQVHYCSRLASGAERPKQPVPSGKQPPYRLDEPPVATHWLHSEALYSIAGAAIRFEFATTLRSRAASAPERVRAAMLAAAAELDQPPPSQEQVALAIAKLLIRRYEQSHLDHLARPASPDPG